MHRFLLLPLLVACADPGLTELEEAREDWARTGSADYQWTVQRSCFCPDVAPIEVVVTGGEVSSATRMPFDAEPVVLEASEYEDWFTVEGMFAIAESALLDADEVTVTYAVDGYPSAIDIDWMRNAVDDETSYAASELAVAE